MRETRLPRCDGASYSGSIAFTTYQNHSVDEEKKKQRAGANGVASWIDIVPGDFVPGLCPAPVAGSILGDGTAAKHTKVVQPACSPPPFVGFNLIKGDGSEQLGPAQRRDSPGRILCSRANRIWPKVKERQGRRDLVVATSNGVGHQVRNRVRIGKAKASYGSHRKPLFHHLRLPAFPSFLLSLWSRFSASHVYLQKT